ncbi:hypothetical protein TorRG33x02_144060 [Trema orientale]|uniref:Uncharacterized protein n=1 Tax=Trema orientale TaxID=63057 RepID=A0A2P5EWH1_TREOI|nr:hypothetical protein TorRG33x02_144060 [Trema orientale]
MNILEFKIIPYSTLAENSRPSQKVKSDGGDTRKAATMFDNDQNYSTTVEHGRKILTSGFDSNQKILTIVEKRSEQSGEAAEQVRPRSKFFDTSRAEASPSGWD